MKKILPVLFLVLLMSSCGENKECSELTVEIKPIKTMDFSGYSAEKPEKTLNLIFLHHSIGGQLLADRADAPDKQVLYSRHPNGGGLRRLLEENNYIVNEATFGSEIGEKTDICHWNEKFRDHMDKILTCRLQDDFYSDGTKNKVVMFKSCYPNNLIKCVGKEPGDPDSCEKTIVNYQAAYNSLLQYFREQPDTLFVVLTAPPVAMPSKKRIGYLVDKDYMVKSDTIENMGKRARYFNNWLKDVENGWLKEYSLNNVVVFDYYDVLTDFGKSNWSVYPTREGKDSHPSSEGNSKAARDLVKFLNKSVNRIGLK